MTADLDAVAGLPVVVGCVDDPGRQPQHPLLDLVQDGQVGARATAPGCGDCHPTLPA